jgi:hypothetical protein
MAEKEKSDRVAEHMDEVYGWKGSLKKTKKVAIKNHEESHSTLKKALSKDQREWEEELEKSKRIAVGADLHMRSHVLRLGRCARS